MKVTSKGKTNFRFFFKINDRVMYINYGDNELHEESIRDMWLPDNEYYYYEGYKGYDANREGLIKFRHDFLTWTTELMSLIDYKIYYTHANAVLNVFKKFSDKNIDSMFTNIKFFECFYMESTNNGGWIKLNQKYKNQTVESYGYDQPCFYPSLLRKTDFKFPKKEGTLYYIEELDYNDLYYGIYKCDIISEHPDFCNMFVFSKTGFYTHFDILFAHSNKTKYSVTITLKLDCNDNCLLYEEVDLIESKTVFAKWFDMLSNARTLVSKENKVIKHLLSSLVGHLIRFDQMKTDNEEEFFQLSISKFDDPSNTKYKLLDIVQYQDKSKHEHRTLYSYVKSNNVYKHNIARMKPFFMSYSRIHMAKLLISENLVDKFIRSHTDNIVLTEPHDFSHLKYFPKVEDKTSGLIIWQNANKYSQLKALQSLRDQNEKFINYGIKKDKLSDKDFRKLESFKNFSI
jgi:hypothetical protein